MATGYTQKIKEGIGFREFVLDCARAFVYNAAELKEKKPNDFHKRGLQKAKEKLKEVQKISLTMAKEKTEKDYQRIKKCYKELNQEKKDLRVKYERMLKQVIDWQPPTSKHKHIKGFMIEQIESSIKFDCSYTEDEPIKKTPEEWIESKIKSCQRNIKYHSEGWEEEQERIKSNNEWLRQLKDSLPNKGED